MIWNVSTTCQYNNGFSYVAKLCVRWYELINWDEKDLSRVLHFMFYHPIGAVWFCIHEVGQSYGQIGNLI